MMWLASRLLPFHYLGADSRRMLLALALCLIVSQISTALGDSEQFAGGPLMPEPWEDFSSIMHYPQTSGVPSAAAGSDWACGSAAGMFPGDPNQRPTSLFKLQMHLRHMMFVRNCARAQQVNVVFVGDSALAEIGRTAWKEMCNLPGGCANFGIPGISAAELAYTTANLAQSCLSPRTVVVMTGANALVEGALAEETAMEVQGVVKQLQNRFCDSTIILAGPLPVAREEDQGAEGLGGQIEGLNQLHAVFASTQPQVEYVDCHDLFLDPANSSSINSLLFEDGLHLSLPGQRLFFQCLEAELSQAQKAPKVRTKLGTEAFSAQKAIINQLLQDVVGLKYRWEYSAWGACGSCTSGHGTQARTSACVLADSGEQVDGSSCNAAGQLPLARSCSMACPRYQWVASAWGPCSADCGGGQQTRQVYCVDTNNQNVAQEMCGPGGFQLRLSQNCSMHSCSFPSSCASDEECLGEATCGLLRCDGPACSRYSRLSAQEFIPDETAALLRTSSAVPKSLAEANQPNAAAPESTWNASYTGIAYWNAQQCYQQCLGRGNCLAADLAGSCVARACDGDSTCTSYATNYHVPSITECLATGQCVAQGCQCARGFGGPSCETPVQQCADNQSPSVTGCCYGEVDKDGKCCPKGRLDANGSCCPQDKELDACQVCGGNSLSRDVLGSCCPGDLDAAGRCCEGDVVDECGVCGGHGTSCSLRGSGVVQFKGADMVDVGLQGWPEIVASVTAALAEMGASGSTLSVAQGDVVLTPNEKGRPTSASLEFVVDLSGMLGNQPISQGAEAQPSVSVASSAGTSTLLDDFHLHLQDTANNGISFVEVRRAGICGNGICEVGESYFAGAPAPNACPNDCPFDYQPARCQQCRNGLCTESTGACDCFSGYAGAYCNECDSGFAMHQGKCVPDLQGSVVMGSGGPIGVYSSSAPAGARAASPPTALLCSPAVLGLLLLSCLLLVTLVAAAAYHVHWVKKHDERQELKSVRHDNPLEGSLDLSDCQAQSKGHRRWKSVGTRNMYIPWRSKEHQQTS